MKINNIELKCCPLCGSKKLKIETKSGPIHHYEKNGMKTWQNVKYSVRCNSCYARGATASVDISRNYGSRNKLKQLEAENNAIEKWNNRFLEGEKTNIFLLVNDVLLGVNTSIEKLQDILFKAYPVINIYNNDKYIGNITRETAWKWMNVHKGRWTFFVNTKFQGKDLDILFFDCKYQKDLREDLPNEKHLLDLFNPNFLDEFLAKEQKRMEAEKNEN